MEQERLPHGFAPMWWSWLPHGVGAMSPAETGERRLLESSARHCPEGLEGGADPRPRPSKVTRPLHGQAGDVRRTTGPRRGNGVDGDRGDAMDPGSPEAREVVARAEQAAAAIIEQARDRAQFEAARIREQATAEAEQARAAILDQAKLDMRQEAERLRGAARDEAARTRESMVAEAREQAFYEGARLRAEATTEAEKIVEEARRAGASAIERADAEADRLRARAIHEAERIKTAIADHAREAAAADASRLHADAVRDAEETRARIVAQAREEAEGIRAAAEQEKAAVLAEAEDQALELHLQAATQERDPDGEVKLLQASDVGAREFPEARRGFDREAVRKWLTLVEASYSTLEDELKRARREWERALESLEVTRIYLGSARGWDSRTLQARLEEQLEAARAAWEQSMAVLSVSNQYHPDYDLPSLLVRSAQLENRLGKRLYGYSAAQVQSLLDQLTTELARLENQVGVLRTENDDLRKRLFAEVTKPRPERLTVLELRPAGAALPEWTGASGTNGSAPSTGATG